MCDLEFTGFVPDDYLFAYGHAMMRRVFEQAPYDSIYHASLTRDESAYRARLEFELNDENFVVEGLAANPKEALEQVEQKVYEHLSDWRRMRLRIAA